MAIQTGSLRFFEDYLKVMEDFLANEADVIRNEQLKYLAERLSISLADIEKMDEVELAVFNLAYGIGLDPEFSGLSDYAHYFPKILRHSLFLALYAHCEKLLNGQCYTLQRIKKLPLSLGDLSGRGIVRARNYLTKVAQINFPDGKEWQEIRTYGKLRNCLAHNDGALSELSESDTKFLKEYALNNLYLDAQESSMATFVELKKGFCEEALKIIDAFNVRLIHNCVKRQFES